MYMCARVRVEVSTHVRRTTIRVVRALASGLRSSSPSTWSRETKLPNTGSSAAPLFCSASTSKTKPATRPDNSVHCSLGCVNLASLVVSILAIDSSRISSSEAHCHSPFLRNTSCHSRWGMGQRLCVVNVTPRRFWCQKITGAVVIKRLDLADEMPDQRREGFGSV